MKKYMSHIMHSLAEKDSLRVMQSNGGSNSAEASMNESGRTMGSLVLGDFDNLEALLPEDYDGEAKYYCSKKFYHTVMKSLARTAGAAGGYEMALL